MWCYFNAVASIVVKVNSIMLPRSTEVIILLYDKHSKHSRTTLLNLKLICRMAEQEFRCTWHLCLGVEFITKDSFINYWRANFPNWNERFFCFQSKTRIIAEPEHRANLDDYSFASLHRFFFLFWNIKLRFDVSLKLPAISNCFVHFVQGSGRCSIEGKK